MFWGRKNKLSSILRVCLHARVPPRHGLTPACRVSVLVISQPVYRSDPRDSQGNGTGIIAQIGRTASPLAPEIYMNTRAVTTNRLRRRGCICFLRSFSIRSVRFLLDVFYRSQQRVSPWEFRSNQFCIVVFQIYPYLQLIFFDVLTLLQVSLSKGCVYGVEVVNILMV